MDQSLDISSLDLNIDLPLDVLPDVIVPPPSQTLVMTPRQQQQTMLGTPNPDLMTFDSSRGYMRINGKSTAEHHPLIPTDTLNTHNLYNLLVKLQQTNKLELTNDSLTSQFYISSQELSSLLEPNQTVTIIDNQTLTEVSASINNITEPNNNNLGIVNQNMFVSNDVIGSNSGNNSEQPIYYLEEQNQGGFFPNQQVMSNQNSIISSNSGASNNYGCQELCCLLKFNALVTDNQVNGVF
jgi:hypothetical protein